MAVWQKEKILFRLVTWSTGVPDSGTYTVKLQPTDQGYPNGAVNCTQATEDGSYRRPEADLDTDKHYDIYVDGEKKRRIFSPESTPPTG